MVAQVNAKNCLNSSSAVAHSLTHIRAGSLFDLSVRVPALFESFTYLLQAQALEFGILRFFVTTGICMNFSLGVAD
jgi:hypothetical protein